MRAMASAPAILAAWSALRRLQQIVDQFRTRVAGADAVDAYAAVRPFRGQAAGEVDHAGLGCVVGRPGSAAY